MDIESDNTITLFDLCWEDILFENLVPLLSLKDLFTLRCCSKTSKEFVDRSLEHRTKINFFIYDSLIMKLPLDIIAEKCRKIKYLNLVEEKHACHSFFTARLHSFIIFHFLIALFENNKNVEHISFTRCCLDYAGIFPLIVQECKVLKSLKLSQSMYTTPGVPEPRPLTVGHPTLEELEISSCRGIKETYLIGLFTKLTNLKRVSIAFTFTITDNVIRTIAQNCKLLTYIDVYGCDRVTLAGYEALITQCPNLKAIDMSGAISLSVLTLVRRRAAETGGERIRLRRCHDTLTSAGLTRQVLT